MSTIFLFHRQRQRDKRHGESTRFSQVACSRSDATGQEIARAVMSCCRIPYRQGSYMEPWTVDSSTMTNMVLDLARPMI